MKIKKILVLMLLVLAIPALVLSCAEDTGGNGEPTAPPQAVDPDPGAGGNGAGNNGADDEPMDELARSATYIEPRPEWDLPVRDLDGYEFRVISRSEASNAHWWNLDIDTEELDGEPINDAVFMRNRAIEEKYNITITNLGWYPIPGRVATSVRAGSDDFDLVVAGLRAGHDSMMQDGLLHDLKMVPYVNLTRPWWDSRAVEQLAIGGRLFATASDLTIRDKDATIIIMFSQTLAQDHGLPNLYDKVRAGTWTFDAMFDMMRQVTSDLNGDGVIDHQDQLGLITQRMHALMLFNAGGEKTVRLNADGLPELTIYNERAVAVTDFIREMQGSHYSINADDLWGLGFVPDVWDGFQVPKFAADEALFYHAGMNRVTLLRMMETDFGIIPPPKFDQHQQNYYVAVDAWCMSAIGIPVTVPCIETTGLILEALTFESRYTLLPAYYHINLITRFARDEESGEMIDLILGNRVFELGDVYSWGGVTGFFHDHLAIGGAQTLTTFYERAATRIRNTMERTIERLAEIGW